jgi:hypothetical protein
MGYEQPFGGNDFGMIPPIYSGDVQSFTTGDNGQNMQRWIKPRGASMCQMFIVGGGGGGGGGKTGATTTARGGGGGGGCSGVGILIIPTLFLPDILLVQVGSGGGGGAASGGGNSGSNSYISTGSGISALSAIPNVILASSTNAAGGGGAGATTSNAAGGTAATNFSPSQAGHFQFKGVFNNTGGIVGATGGLATAGAVGTAITAWNTLQLSPGAGGGSVSAVTTGFAGGAVSIQNPLDFTDGGFQTAFNFLLGGAGSSGGAFAGNPGFISWKLSLFTGGSGGGSTDNAAGGAGGQGAPGCGGGGGGGGTTGGVGGNGGDGFVIIISW